jgi:predicted MFS family arabinose efflux permease
VQGAAYMGVLVMVWIMHSPPQAPRSKKSASGDLWDGFRYVRSNGMVMTLITSSLVMTVFANPYQALLPVFQKDILKVGPEGLGFLLAAPGLGALISTLMLAMVSSRVKRKGILLLISLVMLGVCLVIFSVTPSLPLAFLALCGVGGFQILFLANNLTILQMIVPDEMRGRVTSFMFLDRGMTPLGAMLAGFMAEYIGAPWTVGAMGGVVVVLALLIALRVPRLRTFNPEAEMVAA